MTPVNRLPGISAERLARVLSGRFLLVLIGLGCLFRIAQYVVNRSLWIDEAWLALNIIHRPFGALAEPLDFNQGAPIGFLLVEWLTSRSLGFSEYALRLIPLACALASLFAFAWLARRTITAAAVPLAVLLFAVADGLIYYSSEVKPYSVDVAATIGILAAGLLLCDEIPTRRRALALALTAPVLMAFSFAAAAVVGAVLITLVVWIASRPRERLCSLRALAVSVWLLCSITLVVFGSSRVAQIRASFDTASAGFLGVTGPSSLAHALNAFATNIAAAIGMPQERPFSHLNKLALVIALLGSVGIGVKNRSFFAMMILPFVLVFAASAMKIYPLSQRTELFLLSGLILFLAEGVARVVAWAPARWKVLVGIASTLVVASGPARLAAERLFHPHQREEIKPVLEFLRDHWHRGDTLYVHYGAQYAFLYYEECGCLRLDRPGGREPLWKIQRASRGRGQYAPAIAPETDHILVGPYAGNNWARYLADLRRLSGRRRVWFLYSHFMDSREKAFIQQVLLPRLGMDRRRVEGIDRPRAHAYLYVSH